MGLADHLTMVARSDTGMHREHNEDSVSVEPELSLAVLADGMGGYKAGEVASALAVNTVVSEIDEAQSDGFSSTEEDERGLTPQSLGLCAAIEASNQLIYTTQRDNDDCSGMGTTIVSTLFHGDTVSIAHVGDSRVYRYRDDTLEQLSTDHTMLQELVERGFYTREEARASLNKNLVTRALGTQPEVEVDVFEELLAPGDLFLLCSDGLNDMIDDQEILLTLRDFSANLGRAAQELISRANANGGRDNVSVILVKVSAENSPRSGWLKSVSNWFFN
ncbi:MAG: Stp1/IreP family PP2C-type Ser/Thr phosphatase [Pseudomonadota bacterium]